jgi:hypothetical protein
VKWHAFDVRRGLSFAYLRISKAVRADHKTLLLRCAQEDNGGVLRGAGDWSDYEWMIFAGMTRTEIDDLVGAGVAAFMPRFEATRYVEEVLAAALEEGDRDPDAIPDAIPRKTMRDPVQGGFIGDRDPDRDPGFDGSRQGSREGLDLVVFDYDIGGEVRYREVVEQRTNAVISRWNRAEQIRLRFPTPAVTSEECQPDRDPAIPRDPDAPVLRPVIRPVVHGTERNEEDPPQPPRGRGGQSSPRRRISDPRTRLQLENFWRWLIAARPKSLSREKWGGAKASSFRAILRQSMLSELEVGELLERVRNDLVAKFRDERWRAEIIEEKRSFRTYVGNGDWSTPLAPTIVNAIAQKPPAESAWDRRSYLVAKIEDPDVPEKEKEQFRAKLAELDAQAPRPS